MGLLLSCKAELPNTAARAVAHPRSVRPVLRWRRHLLAHLYGARATQHEEARHPRTDDFLTIDVLPMTGAPMAGQASPGRATTRTPTMFVGGALRLHAQDARLPVRVYQ